MTSSRAEARAPRRLVWLAAFGLAVTSGTAHAADGMPGAETPLPDPAALAAEIVEEAVVEEPVVEAVAEAISVLPVEAPEVAAVEPAVTGAAAAPPPEPDIAAAAAPEVAPEAAPEAAAEEPLEPEPDAPPMQQQPTNLNVSVRIDSPGDDGAVTQANVAVTDAALQYQPEPVRYQPVVPPADAPAEGHDDAAAPTADAGDEASESWEWAWAWDCGSASPLEFAAPAGADSPSWIWNWTWNCDGNTALPESSIETSSNGYHAPVVQYRPVNINIAIRIASPGDNGPVLQTNVAMSLPLPVPAVAAVAGAAEPQAGPSALPEASGPTFAVAVAMLEVGLVDAPAPAEIAAGDASEACCSAPERRGDLWAAEPPASRLFRQAQRQESRDITSVELDTTAVAQLELRSRRAELAEAAPPRPQARPARPARERPSDIGRGNVVSQGAPGIAPVGAPDRRLTYVIVALLAFALSYAFASWAAAAGRPTHGADPDDPPDRPG